MFNRTPGQTAMALPGDSGMGMPGQAKKGSMALPGEHY